MTESTLMKTSLKEVVSLFYRILMYYFLLLKPRRLATCFCMLRISISVIGAYAAVNIVIAKMIATTASKPNPNTIK
jgi:hypothetical protein